MTARCIGLGCKAAPVNALDIGQRWADGRAIYTTACPEHTLTTMAHQRTRNVTPVVFPIRVVQAAGLLVGPCMACWGSHGCDLPDDHEGKHVCGSRDPDGVCMSPDDSWEIFSAVDFEPCARIGGVPA